MKQEYIRYITVPVNKILLDSYSDLGIDEQTLVVVIRLLDRAHRSSQLPDFTQLSKGTNMTESDISKCIQSLMQKELLEVETVKEEGKYIERFTLEPLYQKLTALVDPVANEKPAPSEIRSLFEYVEGLYGRVISPNEFERINSWLEDSNHRPEAIREAVDMAYRNQITSLQYVERILNHTKKEVPESRGKENRMPVRSWLEGEDVFDQ